jgi:hypothetical protein
VTETSEKGVQESWALQLERKETPCIGRTRKHGGMEPSIQQSPKVFPHNSSPVHNLSASGHKFLTDLVKGLL